LVFYKDFVTGQPHEMPTKRGSAPSPPVPQTFPV